MQSINFSGKILHNNMRILGDPLENKTTADEDTKFLEKMTKDINESKPNEFTPEFRPIDSLKVEHKTLGTIILDKDTLTLHQDDRIMINSADKKTTRIITKHEFTNDAAFHTAFKSCSEAIKTIISKII